MKRIALVLVPAMAGALVVSAVAQEQVGPPKPPLDWKDLTRSGIPLKFYGFVRLDAYYNTARANNVILPATVLPESGAAGAKRNDDQFFLDPRLTRFGFDVLPGKVGESEVKGKLEIDFANFPTGSTESRATPRIRLAYIDIGTAEYGLRVGQDWDLIAPLFPAANHELLMWNAGNPGDRRAQIQGRYTPADTGFELKAALGLTGAITGQDLDPAGGGGQVDGFDSGMPHLQVRAGKKGDLLVDKKPADIGLWGAIGRLETDTRFNGESRFDIWLLGADLNVPLSETLTARGEVWTGQNLGDFRAGIGQTVNTTTGREISSIGGWGEVVYEHTRKTRFHVGGTTDDPDNGDLNSGNANRNIAGYVGTVVDWDSGIRTGFDVLYWETDWQATGQGNMVRFNLYFQYSF